MTNALVTYEDYVALPDDGNRYEVIEGELCLVPAPNRKHQKVLFNLTLLLGNFVKARKLGDVYVAPFDVVLSKINVLQPDVLFVSKNRLKILTKAGAKGAPDLAIEILSASTRRRDEVTKLRLYDDFGVDEYWIVDPGRESVRVYRRAGKKLALVSEVFDGFFETPLLAGLTISTPVIFEE